MTISEIAPLLRRGDLSPVELLEAVLERIAGSRLNAFITTMEDAAHGAARQAEREILAGNYRGPLHGIPVAAKDLYHVVGVRTTAGSKILADFIPDYDAAVVERLREAGAVIVGKTNMHEFAFGVDNLNPHYGRTINPWDSARITGGSSGGSAAAVASGLCSAALGSDTGGSIRIPAACCGVVGLKPTYGRVSRYGAVPLSWSQDTMGSLTRSVADAAILLEAIGGFDARDPASARVPLGAPSRELEGETNGLRVGVPRVYFQEGVDPKVRGLFTETLAVLAALDIDLVEITVPNIAEALTVGTTIVLCEAAAYHRDWLRVRPEDYGSDVRGHLEIGSMVLATNYLQAQRARSLICRQVAGLFRHVDAIATPTLPVVAPKAQQSKVKLEDREEDIRSALTRFTRPFNVLGLPAIAVPCGFDSSGLPALLQLAAPPFAEAILLRLAHAYERATCWSSRRPPEVTV